MSWNITYASKEEFAADPPMAIDNLSGEAALQWQLARNVAAEIMASGKVGDASKDWTITLSGHANPNHEPAKGWANDCINIAISQKSA